MSYSDEIKKIRKKYFLSQEAFGREIGVSFSSINRWEGGKSKPNMAAMKKLKDFCDIHGIDFTALEEQWNILGKETEKVVERAASLSPDQLADAYTDLTADLAFAQPHFRYYPILHHLLQIPH